jgi:hypothetical protein
VCEDHVNGQLNSYGIGHVDNRHTIWGRMRTIPEATKIVC